MQRALPLGVGHSPWKRRTNHVICLKSLLHARLHPPKRNNGRIGEIKLVGSETEAILKRDLAISKVVHPRHMPSGLVTGVVLNDRRFY